MMVFTGLVHFYWTSKQNDGYKVIPVLTVISAIGEVIEHFIEVDVSNEAQSSLLENNE